MSKQKLESFAEYKEKKAFLDKTDPTVVVMIFSVLNGALFTVSFLLLFNFNNSEDSISLGYPFVIALGIFDILMYMVIKYLISKRDPLNTLKLKASALEGADIETKERLFKKVSKDLNEEELETFEALIPSFEGSLKELITVSKQLV